MTGVRQQVSSREPGQRRQVVRMGDWTAVRLRTGAPPELYDLKSDPGEKTNVADRHADIVARIEAYLKTGRTTDYQ